MGRRVRLKGDYPFVITTAANAVALYDSQTTVAGDPEMSARISQLRMQLASNQLFAESHARALELLRSAGEAEVADLPGPSSSPASPEVVLGQDQQPDMLIVSSPWLYDSYGTDFSYLAVPRVYSYYGGFYYPFPYRWACRPIYIDPYGPSGYYGNWGWTSFGDGWCFYPRGVSIDACYSASTTSCSTGCRGGTRSSGTLTGMTGIIAGTVPG